MAKYREAKMLYLWSWFKTNDELKSQWIH